MGFKQLFPNENIDFDSSDSVIIYTDGSCIGNGRPDAVGGWAFIIKQKDKTQRGSGNAAGTTNNRMEMAAVLEALKCANPDLPTTVYSDSQYVIETLKGNFRIGKNQELWSELIAQANKFKHIRYIWIRGHADNEYNNEVDRMANAQANSRLQVQR